MFTMCEQMLNSIAVAKCRLQVVLIDVGIVINFIV